MSNLEAREALERAQRLFRERPSAAKGTGTAIAAWRGALQCEITGPNGQKLATDMPSTVGGGGSGPSPGWLLRASLASCTATAIAMRAATRGIELRELEVSVRSETDLRGAVGIDGVSLAMTGMRMSVKVGADNVPESHLREIAEWGATLSTVSATLREQPSVAVEVSVI